MGKVFDKFYSEQNIPLLILHAQRIIQLQKHVFKTGTIIYFVDLLPYNNIFTSFMVTFYLFTIILEKLLLYKASP